MIGKLALAFSAPLLLSNASLPDTITTTHHPSVYRVDCEKGTGTAFRWRGQALLSVNHVTALGNCSINGVPIEVALSSPEQDFSVIRLPSSAGGIPINCEGFKSGELYFAIGHAKGRSYQRMVTLRASDEATRAAGFRDMYVLFGAETVIPGQSGGPILNAAGEAVGMVNAYNPFLGLSFSRQLKDTAVCQS